MSSVKALSQGWKTLNNQEGVMVGSLCEESKLCLYTMHSVKKEQKKK